MLRNMSSYFNYLTLLYELININICVSIMNTSLFTLMTKFDYFTYFIEWSYTVTQINPWIKPLLTDCNF